MRSIIGLSSIALVSLLNVNPLFALTQSSRQLSSNYSEILELTSLNNLTSGKPESSGGVIVSDLFRSINQAVRDQQRKEERDRQRQDRLDREAQRRQDRLDREEKAAVERRERQARIDLARKEASEKQRIEADRRYQYFQSLSPEAKEAYIAEQRAIQKKNNEMAARLFGLVIESALAPRVCQRGSWLTGYTYYDC
ncbi:MAG: hypothetical protein DCF19_04610 [Pseudanabaena frigida]|uniref:DUF1682 domain-containing protein n=1 Tax=Pseudanabaena frigida TaxID=945775 RepID=A0A2W4Y728_9CYAN|nr:MAG: hypothetical protein DCF19_04610 [Pseudanabaena frigida]